jgi:TolA-binding protein
MNQDKDDKALDAYLDGGSAESRRYAALGDELPPPELDARILAAAEREVKVTRLDSRRAPPFKAFAWAAIVVLSFSLVLNIVFQQAVQDPVAELEGMARRADAPVPSSAPAESKMSEIVVEARKTESADAIAPMAAEERLRESPGRVAAQEFRAMEQTEAGGVGSTDAPASRQLLAKQATGLAAAPEPAADLDDGAIANLAKDRKLDRAESIQVVKDYFGYQDTAELQDTEDTVAPLLMELTPATDAELWRLLKLYSKGQEDEAMAALAEFRSQYPDHPVSAELQERGL